MKKNSKSLKEDQNLSAISNYKTSTVISNTYNNKLYCISNVENAQFSVSSSDKTGLKMKISAIRPKIIGNKNDSSIKKNNNVDKNIHKFKDMINKKDKKQNLDSSSSCCSLCSASGDEMKSLRVQKNKSKYKKKSKEVEQKQSHKSNVNKNSIDGITTTEKSQLNLNDNLHESGLSSSDNDLPALVNAAIRRCNESESDNESNKFPNKGQYTSSLLQDFMAKTQMLGTSFSTPLVEATNLSSTVIFDFGANSEKLSLMGDFFDGDNKHIKKKSKKRKYEKDNNYRNNEPSTSFENHEKKKIMYATLDKDMYATERTLYPPKDKRKHLKYQNESRKDSLDPLWKKIDINKKFRRPSISGYKSDGGNSTICSKVLAAKSGYVSDYGYNNKSYSGYKSDVSEKSRISMKSCVSRARSSCDFKHYSKSRKKRKIQRKRKSLLKQAKSLGNIQEQDILQLAGLSLGHSSEESSRESVFKPLDSNYKNKKYGEINRFITTGEYFGGGSSTDNNMGELLNITSKNYSNFFNKKSFTDEEFNKINKIDKYARIPGSIRSRRSSAVSRASSCFSNISRCKKFRKKRFKSHKYYGNPTDSKFFAEIEFLNNNFGQMCQIKCEKIFSSKSSKKHESHVSNNQKSQNKKYQKKQRKLSESFELFNNNNNTSSSKKRHHKRASSSGTDDHKLPLKKRHYLLSNRDKIDGKLVESGKSISGKCEFLLAEPKSTLAKQNTSSSSKNTSNKPVTPKKRHLHETINIHESTLRIENDSKAKDESTLANNKNCTMDIKTDSIISKKKSRLENLVSKIHTTATKDNNNTNDSTSPPPGVFEPSVEIDINIPSHTSKLANALITKSEIDSPLNNKFEIKSKGVVEKLLNKTGSTNLIGIKKKRKKINRTGFPTVKKKKKKALTELPATPLTELNKNNLAEALSVYDFSTNCDRVPLVGETSDIFLRRSKTHINLNSHLLSKGDFNEKQKLKSMALKNYIMQDKLENSLNNFTRRINIRKSNNNLSTNTTIETPGASKNIDLDNIDDLPLNLWKKLKGQHNLSGDIKKKDVTKKNLSGARINELNENKETNLKIDSKDVKPLPNKKKIERKTSKNIIQHEKLSNLKQIKKADKVILTSSKDPKHSSSSKLIKQLKNSKLVSNNKDTVLGLRHKISTIITKNSHNSKRETDNSNTHDINKGKKRRLTAIDASKIVENSSDVVDAKEEKVNDSIKEVEGIDIEADIPLSKISKKTKTVVTEIKGESKGKSHSQQLTKRKTNSLVTKSKLASPFKSDKQNIKPKIKVKAVKMISTNSSEKNLQEKKLKELKLKLPKSTKKKLEVGTLPVILKQKHKVEDENIDNLEQEPLPLDKKTSYIALNEVLEDDEISDSEQVSKKKGKFNLKKTYLHAGLFSSTFKDSFAKPRKMNGIKNNAVEALTIDNQPVKLLAPPPYCENFFRRSVQDFLLPYNIWWEYKNSKLSERLNVPSWNYRKIRTNVYSDVVRPTTSEDDFQSCNCQYESGCSDNCLNRMVYTECFPSNCPCKEKCKNQRIQKHEIAAGIERFMTDNKGWGIRTTLPIKKRTYILEYVGEVVTEREFKERMASVYVNDTHHYCLNLDGGLVIDGQRMGSDGRFVNHSCSPNCEMQKWSVNGLPRMVLFASRDIEPDEEITYDYNFSLFNPSEGQPCRCGTSQCRGVIGGKSQRVKALETKVVESTASTKHSRQRKRRAVKNRKNVFKDVAVQQLQQLSDKEKKIVKHTHIFLLRSFEKVQKNKNVDSKIGSDRSSTPISLAAQISALKAPRNIKTRGLTQVAADPELEKVAKIAVILKEICDFIETFKGGDGKFLISKILSRKRLSNQNGKFSKNLDFSVIKTNIEKGLYKHPNSFDKDVKDVFNSALSMNHANPEILKAINESLKLYTEKKREIYTKLSEFLDKNLLSEFIDKNLPHEYCEQKSDSDEDIIRCICGLYRDEGLMIQCAKCLVWQHTECTKADVKADNYLCEICEARKPNLEIPLDELTEEGHRYYLSLLRGDLQIRQGDAVYVLRDIPINANTNKKHTYETIGKIDYFECDIFRVERLWMDANGKRFIYGHHFLRPHETFHEPSRKFFHNEVVRVPLYEVVPIELVMDRCWVFDSKIYCKGRPIECTSDEHVYICELKVNKAARVFSKAKPDFEVCTKRYAFRHFKEKLRITRNYAPHEVPIAITSKGSKNRKQSKILNLIEDKPKNVSSPDSTNCRPIKSLQEKQNKLENVIKNLKTKLKKMKKNCEINTSSSLTGRLPRQRKTINSSSSFAN